MSEILRLTKNILKMAEASTPDAPDAGIRCRHRIRHNERLAIDRSIQTIKSIERMYLQKKITARQKDELIKNVERFARRR